MFSGANISNSGNIETSSDTDFTIQVLGGSAKITNSGNILGGYGVFSVGALTLTNTATGTITATSTVGVGVLGYTQKDTVTNNGVITGGANGFAVTLNGGDDVYNGQGGRAVGAVLGEGGNDTLRGGAFVDVFDGGEDNDKLYGGGEADRLTGGSGNDLLDGGTGADTLDGGAGNDTIYVDVAGDTVIEAIGGGTDQVIASATYVLKAGVEAETLTAAGTAAIDLTGNEFAQRINGNNGANVLSGLDGADTLYGLGGTDTLNGGLGSDRLYGGLGNDTFVFNTALNATTNRDGIYDFANVSGNNDTIRLDDAIYTELVAGQALGGKFAANATGRAAEADDRIIFNTANGALFYDADGVGGNAGVQFATITTFASLTGATALTGADFLVV